jgi:LCP family protein required for cell wall assembly
MLRTRPSAPAPGPGPLWGIAGKAGYAVCCIVSAVILMTSGWAHYAYQSLAALGTSHAIVSGPSIGEQNILLMGLESRTYWNGQVLSAAILNALHAGSRTGVLYGGVGGNTTNTLILIHIPAGGGKAVGISIPRDDYVTYPQTFQGMTLPYPQAYAGQTSGKIDQAYGDALAARESQLETANHSSLTSAIAFAGNEAGRAAAVATVEQVTGMHIDHFADVNLWGFYELARNLGGVEVCLNHPVQLDANSGFYATHAGYQHLSAKMAMAFVRQRDGLTNGDLDRTHRQQAFIDSVMRQLKTAGVLSDLGKIQSLLSNASQYVVTDSGWDLLDFATQMRSLDSKSITFHTLPILGYQKINGQDDNTINLQQVQQFVQQKFAAADKPTQPHKSSAKHKATTPTPKADPAATTVDVLNGGNTQGLATQVSTALVQAGYKAGTVSNTATRATTEVLYGAGAQGSGDAVASAFNATAQPSKALPAGHVKVLLGANTTSVPSFSTGTSSSSTSTASASPTPTPQSSYNAAGGAVNAVNGIPCVD